MKNIILFLGPPGSGKGTQSRIIANKIGAITVGMGDLLRAEVNSSSPIGLEIKDIMSSGGFPDINLVTNVLENHLRTIDNKIIILDGFPRNIAQAEKLEQILYNINAVLSIAILLHIDKSTDLINRILNRYICKQCETISNNNVTCNSCYSVEFYKRHDDTDTVARKRIESDNAMCVDIINKYTQQSILERIDATNSINMVTDNIISCIVKQGLIS